MISPINHEYILTRAYVPEHIVSLMVSLSKGEPFFVEDHLIFARDNWLILVGYPLDGMFLQERCEKIVEKVVETFRPEYLWFILFPPERFISGRFDIRIESRSCQKDTGEA